MDRARRSRRCHRRPGRDREALATADGHYAGIVTRFVGLLVDAVAIMALFTIGGHVWEYVIGVVAGHAVELNDSSGGDARIALGTWAFVALAVPLAAGGRTIGMTVVGLRAVRADGGPLGTVRAVVRTLALPLSFAIFGLGFLLIVLRGDRRALHDLIGGSAVVYATHQGHSTLQPRPHSS